MGDVPHCATMYVLLCLYAHKADIADLPSDLLVSGRDRTHKMVSVRLSNAKYIIYEHILRPT